MCAVNVAEGNLEDRWEGAKTLHKTMITLPRWWHTNSVGDTPCGPHTCKDAHIT